MPIISSAPSGDADERASQQDFSNVAESFHHRGTEDIEKSGTRSPFAGYTASRRFYRGVELFTKAYLCVLCASVVNCPFSRRNCEDAVLAARQHEVDRDLRFHLDRLAIEQIWAIAPLPHCLDRGGDQHGMSADNGQVLNRAVLADDRAQLD